MCKLALVSVFKNNGDCLREWIKHYMNEGVDYFFLTDNGSTDNYLSEIQDYVNSGVITLHKDPKKFVQVEHLNYHLKNAKKFDWVILVDSDEFLYSRKQYRTIKDYLKTVSKCVNKIVIPWKMFGSSHLKKQPSSIVQNFIYRQQYPLKSSTNDLQVIEQKCIVRGPDLIRMHIHDAKLKGDCKNEQLSTGKPAANYYTQITETLLEESYLHLNHYRVQTWELFSKNKMLKGDAAGNASKADKRDRAYFNRFDTNDLKDTELKNKKYLPRKTRRIKRKIGGTAYYPYNNKPLLFTNSSRQYGGFDSRSTLFPSAIVNGLRSIGHSINESNAVMNGSYKEVDPSWRIQSLK
jgi:hypothetical protein